VEKININRSERGIKKKKMKNLTKPVAANSWLKSMQASIAIITTVVLCICLSGCKKEDLGETSGTISYGNNIYTVYIGEIWKGEDNTVLIELMGNMPGEVTIKNGKMQTYLGMRIIVDGKTIENEYALIKAGKYDYIFDTTKNPSKIIVYSNDGSNATLTFDGKRKTVIPEQKKR